jgi:uncharacterized metal-binding protein YceD (DUF177 family)
MPLSVLEFLAHPGCRFPVRMVLDAVDDETHDLRTVREIRLEGEAFAQLATLYVDVEMTAIVAQPCGRCLKPLETPFVLREEFTVRIPPTADEVDVRPTIVSLILTAHNPNALCRPDCHGLCKTCGADLNENHHHVCAERDQERRKLGDFLRP